MGNATKAAVNGATTTLATELGPRNIRVNSINPAGDHIRSPGGRLSPKRFPQTNGGPQPARSHRPAHDIARAAVFLASADAARCVARVCSGPHGRSGKGSAQRAILGSTSMASFWVERRRRASTEGRYGQSRIGDRRSGLAETRAMARGFGSGIDPLRRGNYREAHSLEWVRPLLATIAPDELDLERLIVVVDGPKNWRRWHSI